MIATPQGGKRRLDIVPPPNSAAAGTTAAKWPLKLLAAVTIFLISAVFLPSAEALEVSLNPENLLAIINQDRSAFGLPKFEYSDQLRAAAALKAQDMLLYDYFAHTSPTGTRPWEFLDRAGFRFRFAGENLALNYQSAYELVRDFMQSPSHRANLLSPDFAELGIAIVPGELEGEPALVTVLMFGTEADSAY